MDDITAISAREAATRIRKQRQTDSQDEELNYYLEKIRWAAEECCSMGITMPGLPITETTLAALRYRGFIVDNSGDNYKISW